MEKNVPRKMYTNDYGTKKEGQRKRFIHLPLEGVPLDRGDPRPNRGRVLKQRHKHGVFLGCSAQRRKGGRSGASPFLHRDGLWYST